VIYATKKNPHQYATITAMKATANRNFFSLERCIFQLPLIHLLFEAKSKIHTIIKKTKKNINISEMNGKVLLSSENTLLDNK
jgi:hypothetical protein